MAATRTVVSARRPVLLWGDWSGQGRLEVTNILEAFDLTGSYREAAELAGCSHHTIGDWVAKRDRGELPVGPAAPVDRSLQTPRVRCPSSSGYGLGSAASASPSLRGVAPLAGSEMTAR